MTRSRESRPAKKVETEPIAGGFLVRHGDQPMKTPGGAQMVLPSQALAEAIADEWRDQGPRPKLEALPFTRIAATALDRIPPRRAGVLTELMAYAETELVCHRASSPAALVARQQEVWQPLLDWLVWRFDAPLAITVGVLPRAQSSSSLAALRHALEQWDNFRLAGLSVAVAAAGSLVIGLALAEGRVDVDTAFAAAELDASYQIEQWGEDEIATRRREGVRADLDLAARFFDLLGRGDGG